MEREKYAAASFGGLGAVDFSSILPSRNFSIAHSNSLVHLVIGRCGFLALEKSS